MSFDRKLVQLNTVGWSNIKSSLVYFFHRWPCSRQESRSLRMGESRRSLTASQGGNKEEYRQIVAEDFEELLRVRKTTKYGISLTELVRAVRHVRDSIWRTEPASLVWWRQ